MTLAMDPPTSEAQRRAMFAAASGHSTLGIPRTVGREYVAADATVAGAGVAMFSPDDEVLLLRRAGTGDHVGEWCWPGGTIEDGETPHDAARRETLEEVGSLPSWGLHPLDRRVVNGVDFATFAQRVPGKFEPKLNDEHDQHVWASLDDLPSPLHPGVAATLESLVDPLAADQSLAMDEETVRSYDSFGRLHVSASNITKANVCGYLGKEIPNYKELGLDAARMYYLFRDPEELAKAAPSFNNLPILRKHVAVSVVDHKPEDVIGSTGTDAEFTPPFMRNSLVFWAKQGVQDIESEEKKELSASYRYRADMTPGVYMGIRYDGVMRSIAGNHVALVKDGRAGDDVVVGDSMENIMIEKGKKLTLMGAVALGALATLIHPKLAMDQKITLGDALDGVTGKNFAERRKAISAAVIKAVEGKLAKGMTLAMDDVSGALENLQNAGGGDALVEDPNSAVPAKTGDAEGGVHAKILDYLKDKLPPEALAQVTAMIATEAHAGDAETDEDKKKAAAAAAAKDAAAKDAAPPFVKKDDAAKDESVTKPAMDEAIKVAVAGATAAATKNQSEIRDAERFVRPWVGDMAVAFDSASGVYEKALTVLGKSGLTGLPTAALKAVLEAQPVPGSKPRRDVLAHDSAPAGLKPFSERFPNAARIQATS